MPPKDFSKSLKSRRIVEAGEAGQETSLGVLGSSAMVAELERTSATLPVREIEIERLLDNPYQYLSRPTINEEALDELASSIRENGFFGALVARYKSDARGYYELAYGHRRREAARRAGLTTLPIKILDLTDKKMAQLMASENFSRENLTPMGEANVVGLLASTQNLSVREISEAVGKSTKWVDLRRSLYEAPQDLRQMVETRPDTLTHLQILSQLPTSELRAPLIEAILKNELNRNQLQGQVSRLKSNPASGKIVKEVTNLPQRKNSEKIHNDALDNRHLEEALAQLIVTVGEVEKAAAALDYNLLPQSRKLLQNAASRLNDLLG